MSYEKKMQEMLEALPLGRQLLFYYSWWKALVNKTNFPGAVCRYSSDFG